jgi:uncharacterized membrane protein YqiK
MNDDLIKELQKQIKAIDRRKVISIDALSRKISLKHQLALALGEIDQAEYDRREREAIERATDAWIKAKDRATYISPRYRNGLVAKIKRII